MKATPSLTVGLLIETVRSAIVRESVRDALRDVSTPRPPLMGWEGEREPGEPGMLSTGCASLRDAPPVATFRRPCGAEEQG